MRRALFLSAMVSLALGVARTLHGWFPVRVAGASMTPTIQPGDLLAVRPCRPDEPMNGDIVVLRRDDREIVKRVVPPPLGVSIGPDQVWVEGDARAGSTDSRELGAFQRLEVAGVVAARYWPSVRTYRR